MTNRVRLECGCFANEETLEVVSSCRAHTETPPGKVAKMHGAVTKAIERGSPVHATKIEALIAAMTGMARDDASQNLQRYGPFASVHEASSVLEEELQEIKAEVFRKPGLRSKLAIRNEALNLASVALRLAAQMDFEQSSEGQRLESDWAES